MRYANVDELCITRRRFRGRWVYLDDTGARITDPAMVERLDRIGLPPAYADARFAPAEDLHIQAVGIDARGRRQYVYHPGYVALRDARKFDACAGFGRLLSRMRARVERDIAGPGLSRERAVASIVRLLDSGRIRVGNESYARANGSFGATTLRRRHARLKGRRLTLCFRAKSGRLCRLGIADRCLIRFVRRMQDLPGQHLFQYRGEDGHFHPVTSTDVNAYVQEVMGGGYAAKDFRTWRASVLAFEWLRQAPAPIRLGELLEHVAQHLGNTPAVARKSYIHPALIELARAGSAQGLPRRLPRATRWLTASERGLLAFLDAQAC